MVQESRREIGARWALRDRHGEAISMRCANSHAEETLYASVHTARTFDPAATRASSFAKHSRVHQRGKTWLVSHRLILKETDREFRE